MVSRHALHPKLSAIPRAYNYPVRPGTWLVDLAGSFPNAQFTGTDISTSLFPHTPPSNIAFLEQDISKPWPMDLLNKYDLVHQRLVLLHHGPNLTNIINGLCELVKPGGWIQLVEGDINDHTQVGPAGTQFLTVVSEFVSTLGGSGDFLDRIPDLLDKNGFDRVQVRHFTTRLGALNEDETARNVQAEMHRGPPTMIGGMLKGELCFSPR